jgi:hypothetical protein
MGEKKTTYPRYWWENVEKKRLSGRPSHRWEDDIKEMG